MMNDELHPLQQKALEKLKKLRVGALYMERQEGKLRTVIALIRYRLQQKKIDGVLWLCTHRRIPMLQAGIIRYIPEAAGHIFLFGIEGLSHAREKFQGLMDLAQHQKLMLIIDNGLLIKNIHALRTQRTIALSRQCPYRLLIGDVPFSCQAADIFAQWYALDWRILGYRSYWGFCINHVRQYRSELIHTAYLARAIAPYCVQILRDEVQDAGGRKEYIWKFSLPKAAMAEYRQTMQRFLMNGLYANTGVYQLLQACQQVVCGRKILRDYPLETAPLYASSREDPRLQAFWEVAAFYPGKRILVLFRYHHEAEILFSSICQRCGPESVARYPLAPGEKTRPFMIMNVFTDEREYARLQADVIIYYSCDWNWRKRQEKERQCQNALEKGELTVVNLIAADTIDELILRCIWKKDSLVNQLRKELMKTP